MFSQNEKDSLNAMKLAEEKPGFFRKLKDFGFIVEEKNSIEGYAHHPTGADPNVSRFIAGLAYWPDQVYGKKIRFKKVILNYRNILLTPRDYKVIEFFLTHHIPLLIRSGEGRYVQLQNDEKLKDTLSKVTITSTKKITSELSDRQENTKDFFIMNDPSYLRFCHEFYSLLILNFGVDTLEEILEIAATVFEKYKHQIIENLEDRQLSRLELIFEDGNKYYFNQINGSQLSLPRRELLLLANEVSPVTAEVVIGSHIEKATFNCSQEIKAYTRSYPLPSKIFLSIAMSDWSSFDFSNVRELTTDVCASVDVSIFKNLEVLLLSSIYSDAFGEPVVISGIDQCTQLKRLDAYEVTLHQPLQWKNLKNLEWLEVKSDNLEVIDISSYKKLKTLKVTECPELKKIIGLENASQLIELTIVDCPQLTTSLPSKNQLIRVEIPAALLFQSNIENKIEVLKIREVSEFIFDAQLFPQVRELEISQGAVWYIEFRGGKIEHLKLNALKELIALKGLETLKQLKTLFINGVAAKLFFRLPSNNNALRSVSLDFLDAIEDAGNKTNPYHIFPELEDFKICKLSSDPDYEGEVILYEKRVSVYRHLLEFDNKSLESTTLPNVNQRSFDCDLSKKNRTVHVQRIFEEDDPGLYRTHISNNIQYHHGKLSLHTIKDEKLSSDRETKYIPRGKSKKGTENISLLPGEVYELTGFSANDHLISWSQNQGLLLRYDRILNQYILKNTLEKTITTTISYQLISDSDYLQTQLRHEPSRAEIKMPEEMRQVIDHFFNENSTLQDEVSINFKNFMDKLNQASPREKINLLRNRFYNEFDDEAKGLPLSKDDLIQSLNMFKYKKGVCRHRALIMSVIGWYLGFNVRIVHNKIHGFVEILTDKGWKGFDLNGGGDNQYIYHPPVKMQPPNPFMTEKKEHSIADIADHKRTLENKNEIKKGPHHASLFYSAAHSIEKSKNLTEFMQNLLKHPGNPLIRTVHQEDEKRLDQLLKSECDKLHIPHLYIDNASELTTLFNGILLTKEGLSDREGKLKAWITSDHKAILVINWNQFSPTDRAIYKSLLDDPPTLHGHPIKRSLKIVGILQLDIKASDIFSSRCDELKVPNTLPLPVKAMPQRDWVIECKEPPTETAFVIDLYHSPDWHLLLVEKLSLKGFNFLLKKSDLWTAMRLGINITLKNPPFGNEEFDRFWFHLLNEETLESIDGETIKRHPSCKIYWYNDSNPTLLHSSIRLTNGIPESHFSGKTYHINRENFGSYLEGQHIDQKGFLHSGLGLLSEYKAGDRIVIQDEFSSDKIRMLNDAIAKLNHHHPVDIVVDSRFEKIMTEAKYAFGNFAYCSDPAAFAETTDAEFVLQELKIATENIFYLDGKDSWPTLIESVTLKREDKVIKSDRFELPFWEKLQKGETVAINGGFTLKNYIPLQTLFNDPPYLIVNGKRCEVKGRIIWLHGPADTYPMTDAPRYKVDFRFRDYINHFRSLDFDEPLLKKVFNFFELAAIPVNLQKIKAIYELAINDKNEQDNPIKSMTSEHYRHDPELFAYLNVLGKFLFSFQKEKTVRHEKVFALRASLAAGENEHAIFWQLVNCLNGAALREVFSEGVNKNLSSSQKTTILDELNKALPLQFYSKRTIHLKQKQRIKLAIQQGKRLIFLMGASGLGKTKVALDLMKEMKCEYHYGENKIDQWLKGGGYLILDEMNLAKSGHWQWLSGMFANPPSIYYRHTTQLLSEKHKIIATGNPLNFPNRYFHQVLYDYAEIVHFKKFKDHELAQVIEEGWQEFHLTGTDQEKQVLTDFLISIYRLLETSPQYPLNVDLRDLKNILVRISVLQGRLKKKPLDELARLAVWEEFSNSLITDQAQGQFKDYLQIEALPITQAFPRDVVVTQVKQPLWQIIYDDLRIAELRIEAKNNDMGKLGILLEGPSGVGKSTLFISVLESMGFSRLAEDTQKRYYQITVGSQNVKELLLKAFEEGSKVILDELNLDSSLENLLNQLLSGKNEAGKPAKKPGFGVFASQNPGEGKVSLALISRFHKLKIQHSDPDELLEIAIQLKVPSPADFVEKFMLARKEYPRINERTFFQKAKTVASASKESELASNESEPWWQQILGFIF